MTNSLKGNVAISIL